MAHEKLKYQISIGLLLASGQYTKTENIAYMRGSLFELDANMKWLSFLCEIIKKNDSATALRNNGMFA